MGGFLPWLEFLWHTSAASLRDPVRYVLTCTGGRHARYTSAPSLRDPRELGAGVCRGGAPRYSSDPSFVRACKLGPGVYRHRAPPALERAEFADPLQTRRGCVSASQPPPHTPGATLQDPENWGRVRTRGAGALARTRHDLAKSCKLAADVCRQPAWHEAPAARYPSAAGTTPVARISSRAASSSTGTPSCCAFVSFEPAASPATT